MSLLNVRLSPEDAARVKELRRHGVQISRLVREALRAELEKRSNGHQRDLVAMVEAIHAKYPDPTPRPSRPPRDRERFRKAAAKHFRRHNRTK
jgi:hypothetical protein